MLIAMSLAFRLCPFVFLCRSTDYEPRPIRCSIIGNSKSSGGTAGGTSVEVEMSFFSLLHHRYRDILRTYHHHLTKIWNRENLTKLNHRLNDDHRFPHHPT